MTPADRARIDALFDAALGRPEAERAAYVRQVCGGEAWLADEVEGLLALAGSAASRLEPEALAQGPLWAELAQALTARTDTTDAGQVVGSWRLVRELGRGGMGTVWLAERADGQFTQRAALKLLGSGPASADLLRRFELERQILASLEHPNIARLLDGGCDAAGRPFFVMEYVDGQPIDSYCDAQGLTLEERLDLFARVGRAVQHAHRNLVVHRDVKPANIVVTHAGEVKLLDFGIAKLLAVDEAVADPLTRTVMRVLTPEYASPEQVRGAAITTASDVYQLGLLLFELLTGARAQALASLTPVALERAVCEAPAPRPSSLAATASPEVCAARRCTRAGLVRRLRGDLDNIVLCALRKEPERRYASVDELLDDLQRFRRGRPIRAHTDALVYRARKFVGRHGLALAWGLVLGTGALVSAVLLAAQQRRAAHEAQRAQQMEELFQRLFFVPGRPEQVGPPQLRDIVDHAARLVERELRQQPASRVRLLRLLGDVYMSLGAYEPAARSFERALEDARQTYGTRSAPVVAGLVSLCRAQHYGGRYGAAEAACREALAVRRGLPPGAGADGALEPALELGDLLHSRGHLDEAEAVLRQVLPTLRAGGPSEGLARVLRDLANVLRDRGDLQQARPLYVEALELLRPRPPDDTLRASAQVDYGRLLLLAGDLESAEAWLRRGIATLDNSAAGEPANAIGWRNLGQWSIERGRYPEARRHLGRALEILVRVLGTEHPQVPRAQVLLAELERRTGRPREAVELARQAQAQFVRLGLAEHPAAIEGCATLGAALRSLRQQQAASAALEPCLRLAERRFAAGDARTRHLRQELALASGIRAPHATAAHRGVR